jgi:hypothetical protein
LHIFHTPLLIITKEIDMHQLRHTFLPIVLMLVIASSLQAQIPNAGFESWTNATTPTSWFPNNSIYWTTITRSGDFHSGSFAVQGQVASYAGLNVSPTMISMRFPVSQRYTTFSGFYKFTPVGHDVIGAIISMYKNSSPIGAGGGTDSTPYAAFTSVDMPISYFDGTTVPDSAFIEILIAPDPDSSDVHVGSTFIVDDLSLSEASGVKELPGLPRQFRLEQNFPNPFNPTTRIAFSLPRESHVSLKVYNMAGELVATLADEVRHAGNYAADMNAAHLPSGVYFYKLVAGSFIQTKKMMLMK